MTALYRIRVGCLGVLVSLPVSVGKGCAGPSESPPLPVLIEPTFEAGSPTVVGGTLSVVWTVRNSEAYEVTFELRRPCGTAVMVYDADDDTALVWDGWSWLSRPPGGCKGGAFAVILGPSESIQRSAAVAVADILGDSLPSQMYRISVSVVVGPPADQVEVQAPGLVMLTNN